MTVLQPIAPAGGVSVPDAFQKSGDPSPSPVHLSCTAKRPLPPTISLNVCCAGDAAEDILARFERERKHVPVKRKVGAGFDLGFPT